MRIRLLQRRLTALLVIVAGGCREPASPSAATVSRDGSTHRVISLAPSLTEMIAAIGAADQLVGRSTACDYPSDVLREVPAVGGFGTPSIEALLARHPSLIVDVALADKTLEHRMQTAGLRREHIPCNQLDDIPAALRRLGRLLDRGATADQLATTIENELTRLRADADNASERAPLVFVELWADPLMTIGRGSFIAECVRLAGGRNLGDEQDADYYYLSHEQVIARNPDVILMLTMSGDEPAIRRVADRIGWDAIDAVRAQRVYSDFDQDILLRPGPRVLEGIAQLRAAIGASGHPPPDAP